MADGAHLGVSASRALKTILGGEPSPTEDECMGREEFASRVRSAPHDLEDIVGEDPYGEASEWLARRYLLIIEQAPAVTRDIAWEVFRARWPEDAEEAGGMTGFMHGWAWNAARNALSKPAEANPAILTIGPRRPSLIEKVRCHARRLWANRYGWLKIQV